MLKQGIYTILTNEQLTAAVWRMTLAGDTRAITAPGQFVEAALPGHYLRRPISVCDYDATTLVLVYKVVGVGTADMSRMRAGMTLDLLTGLGNGFPIDGCERPLLVGGGVGIPPLYALARRFRESGRAVAVVLGFQTASEAFYVGEFRALGCEVTVSTADGSLGVGGFVTDALKVARPAFDRFYACGPLAMLRALSEAVAQPGFLSFEERMGCGFGACMGCSIPTRGGSRRVCREGPVFEKNEILWP